VYLLPTLDADHHVLRLGSLRAHVVDVVRHDERDARPARHLAYAVVHPRLFGDSMRHELEVVVAFAEDLTMLLGDGAGRVDTIIHQRARELALETRGECYQPLTALAEELLVHARPVVVALEVGRGHE